MSDTENENFNLELSEEFIATHFGVGLSDEELSEKIQAYILQNMGLSMPEPSPAPQAEAENPLAKENTQDDTQDDKVPEQKPHVYLKEIIKGIDFDTYLSEKDLIHPVGVQYYKDITYDDEPFRPRPHTPKTLR